MFSWNDTFVEKMIAVLVFHLLYLTLVGGRPLESACASTKLDFTPLVSSKDCSAPDVDPALHSTRFFEEIREDEAVWHTFEWMLPLSSLHGEAETSNHWHRVSALGLQAFKLHSNSLGRGVTSCCNLFRCPLGGRREQGKVRNEISFAKEVLLINLIWLEPLGQFLISLW